MKFYRCDQSGTIVQMVEFAGTLVSCCGQKMSELVPGTDPALAPKHVPIVNVNGNEVRVFVGAVEHPMLPEHYIQWIALETNLGSQMRYLSPGQKPEAVFLLTTGERVESVYAYCNIHGLWKA